MTSVRAWTALTVCLMAPLAAEAGLYSTEEPPTGLKRLPSADPKGIKPDVYQGEHVPIFQREYLPELRRMTRDDKSFNLRKKFLDRLAELRKRQPLTEEDQVNISFYLIRLGQAGEALQLLRNLDARGTRNFMVLANLATAYQLSADAGDNPVVNYGQARFCLDRVLRRWPKSWPGLTSQQLEWYRKAESFQLALVKGRLAEASKTSRPAKTADTDAIFPTRFHFFEKDGKYRAGLAPVGEEGLKGDEIGIVQQLLTWLPNDNRLYWLFGELVNAGGDIRLAAVVLEDCVYNQNMSAPLLKDHRRVLKQAAAELPSVPPGPAPGDPDPTDGGGGGWMPQMSQLVVVGGIGGLIVLVLAYFQVRELRRRRARKLPGPVGRTRL